MRYCRADIIDLSFPIGREADIANFFEDVKVLLKAGDVAVLFADSIAGTKNRNETQHCVKLLREAIKPNLPPSAIEIGNNVINDRRQYIDGQKVYDEITLVVLKQK